MTLENMYSPGERDDFGFTLVELILATLIFSVVAVTVFSTFGTVLKSVEPMEKGLENRTAVQDFVNLFREDLGALVLRTGAAYKPPGMNDDADPYRFTGVQVSMGESQGSRIRFVSGHHIAFDGLSEGQAGCIVYHVREDGRGGFDIRRYDSTDISREFTGEEMHPAVLKGVSAFILTYLTEDGEIRDSWDSESETDGFATPRAV